MRHVANAFLKSLMKSKFPFSMEVTLHLFVCFVFLSRTEGYGCRKSVKINNSSLFKNVQ